MPEFKENGAWDRGGEVESAGHGRKPRRRRNPIASNSTRRSGGNKTQMGPCTVDAMTFAADEKPQTCAAQVAGHRKKSPGDDKYSTAVVGGSREERGHGSPVAERQFRRRTPDRRRGRWSGGEQSGRREREERSGEVGTADARIVRGLFGKILRVIWPFGKKRQRGAQSQQSAVNFTSRPRGRGGRGRQVQ